MCSGEGSAVYFCLKSTIVKKEKEKQFKQLENIFNQVNSRTVSKPIYP